MGHNNNRSVFFPLHCGEILCSITGHFFVQWQRVWRESCVSQRKGLFLLGIKNEITQESVVDTGNRRTDCLIHRMRIGHVPLNYYLYRLGLVDSDQCSYCGTEETLEHYLMECDQFFDERSRMFISIFYIIGYPPRLSLKLLLGGGEFSAARNKLIVRALATYIRNSRRFS